MQKEISDKRLLKLVSCQAIITAISYTVSSVLLCCTDFGFGLYMTVGIFLFLLHTFALILFIKLLQCVGYYRCVSCGYTYTPTFRALWYSLPGRHKRTLLRCPNCKKYSGHDWVSNKE